MNAFIDTTKIWYFDYSGNFLNTFLPVIMKVKAGKLLIKIPNGVKGMTIEILSYDQKAHILKGRYTIHDYNLCDEVDFKIINSKNLIGQPKGFHGQEIWTLLRE